MIATARNGPAEIQFSSFLTQLKAPPSSEHSMRSEGQTWSSSPARLSTHQSDATTTLSQPLPSFTLDHSSHNYYASSSALPARPASSFPTPTGYYSQHVLPLRDQHATSTAPSWSASTYSTGAPMIGDYLHQPHAPQQPAIHPFLQHSESMPRSNDEDLAIDAQMLREVLQEMPTGQTPVVTSHATQSRGPQMPGLQLLFVSPTHSTNVNAAPVQPPGFYSTSMAMTAAPADMLLTMSQTVPVAPIDASGPTQDRTLASTLPLPSGLISPYDASADAIGMGSASALMRKKRATATRICKVEGCTKGIRSRGLCKAHGGGRRCTTPGCTTSDQGGGHCVLHGGGRRCRIEGCNKSAQWRGVCKMHGGARRCRYGQCTKNGQVKQGYCRMHHNLLTAQRQQQEQLQAQQLHQLHPPSLPSVAVKLATEGI